MTFAQFTERVTGTSTQNFTFTRNGPANGPGTSGRLNTANTALGDDVYFSYLGFGTALPVALQGQQNAHVTINGGAGVLTTASVITTVIPGVGTLLTQPFNNTITIAFTRDTAFVPTLGTLKGQSLTNLLTVTITPRVVSGVTNSPALSGFQGASSASGSYDSNSLVVTFTSDFLDFSNTVNRDAALSFSALLPSLARRGNYLRTFRADATGTFDSDPAPILLVSTLVPEPASMALLGTGLLGVVLAGSYVQRRAKATPAA